MRLSTLTFVRSEDRFCRHCERVTRWTDRAGYARCTYCDREAPPDPTPADRPARASAIRRTRDTLQRYPLLLVLLLLLVSSFALASWLDARADATPVSSAQPTDAVEILETG
ncbi:MAG: hypothetical protein GVY18_15935 [Bacteroidetes bacterium]|nr:hypothetical protein [Bacteroidota bacterium]